MQEEITYGDDGEIKIVLPAEEEEAPPAPPTEEEEKGGSLWQQMKERATEDDTQGNRRNLTLRQIIGGEILITEVVRKQIWVVIVVTIFIFIYIAQGYAYKKLLLDIDRCTTELRDAKYRALSIESDLTEKTRESKVMEMLKLNHDSLLQRSAQPPFVIKVPKK